MGESRRCGICAEDKSVDEFMWRRTGRERDNMCRGCRAAYKRRRYLANKARYVAQAKARQERLRRERTLYLLRFFEDHPCVDCGETDPVVLEFDHIRDKSFAVGANLDQRNWQSILDEIEKCEVVCSNCHRRRTARRRGALRLILTQN